ncbi:unnamed protein product [Caenorhabditis brenneri]
MKINILFFIFFFYEVFICEAGNLTLSELFQELGNHGNRCIEGKDGFDRVNNPVNTEKYRLIDCTTRYPKCGYIVRNLKESSKEIQFGCFSIAVMKSYRNGIVPLDNDFYSNCVFLDNFDDGKYFQFENLKKMFVYLVDQMPESEEYFINKMHESVEDSGENRYGYENQWVENPSDNIFERRSVEHMHIDSVFSIFLSHGKVTLIMLIYTLFICFSVIFKLFWLVSVALKTVKQGYEEVKEKEKTQDSDETVDELE